MRKPWFKSITFWTGFVVAALTGPAAPFAVALWCAGFAAYRLNSKNQQSNNLQGKGQSNNTHQQPDSHNQSQEQGKRKQQEKAPYNPYHNSQNTPPDTPISPKIPKGKQSQGQTR